MLVVSELSEVVFPKQFLDTLEHECPTCGHDNMITETLTKLVCPNPYCTDKLAVRMKTMLADLGVKNMGESRCRKFFDTYELTNPYAIFALEPYEGDLAFEGASEDFSISLYESLNLVREMTLWDYVKIGNMPSLRDSSLALFSNYATLEDFYDEFESEDGGVAMVQRLLGIQKENDEELDVEDIGDVDLLEDEEKEGLTFNGYSLKALKVSHTLKTYKEDLFEYLEFIEFKRTDLPVINLTISTSVGEGYSSKVDFINKMNRKFTGKAQINILSSATKKTDVLIWSGVGAPTSKVQKIRKYNMEYEQSGEYDKIIPIMTGQEFETSGVF